MLTNYYILPVLECAALMIQVCIFLSFHPKDLKLAYSMITLKHEDTKPMLLEMH